MEDVILSTSMSMEAAGELIGERDGEGFLKGRGRNLPIALCVYRCLHVLDLELPSVFGGLAGMSKAIANTYNAIKHSSRGKFPDVREVRVVCDVNSWLLGFLRYTLRKWIRIPEFGALSQIISIKLLRICRIGL